MRTLFLTLAAAALMATCPGQYSAKEAISAAAPAQPENPACPAPVTMSLEIHGSILCIDMDDRTPEGQRRLRTWIDRSARIVAAYYSRFPARRIRLQIMADPGNGVRGGHTTNDSGLAIQVRVGTTATDQDLAADWVLVHEMVHLALPEVGRRHLWLAEGLATYVEGIARAQYGNRDIRDVWAEQRRSMPLGLPRAGEGGMDETAAWGRTYWGGALFCLQAEVAIREQTANRVGLQSALRAILRETTGYGAERDINEVLRIGDTATGTHVLENLYQLSRTTPQVPDLDALWKSLGVPQDPMTQPFDDQAPLAAIRIAMTAPPGVPP